MDDDFRACHQVTWVGSASVVVDGSSRTSVNALRSALAGSGCPQVPLCSPGSVFNATVAVCQACPAGTFFNSSTLACQTCPSESYQPLPQQLACLPATPPCVPLTEFQTVALTAVSNRVCGTCPVGTTNPIGAPEQCVVARTGVRMAANGDLVLSANAIEVWAPKGMLVAERPCLGNPLAHVVADGEDLVLCPALGSGQVRLETGSLTNRTQACAAPRVGLLRADAKRLVLCATGHVVLATRRSP
jgi:hypothetical protein